MTNTDSTFIKKVILLVAALVIIVFLVKKCGDKVDFPGSMGMYYNYESYPEDWPFTVPELWVYKVDNQIIALDNANRKFGLNGNAKTRCTTCKDIETIWKSDISVIVTGMNTMKKIGEDPFSISMSPYKVSFSKILDDFNDDGYESKLIEKVELGKVQFSSSYIKQTEDLEQISSILSAFDALRIGVKGEFADSKDAAKKIALILNTAPLLEYEFGADSLKWIQSEFSKRVKKLQPKVFENARKAFASELSSGLWRDNIYVHHSGKTLTFTGARYANNGNILDDYNALRDLFEKFRFKKIIYKWYDYDDSPTSFTVSSLSDTD